MSLEIIDPQQAIAIVTVGISMSAAISAIVGAIKAGVLTKVKIGGFEFNASTKETLAFKKALQNTSETPEKEVPFEIEQLANYYSQILSQSKISFWFSLVFASLGFATIVVSAFLYSNNNGTATIAQFSAGLIMDAVAGLFFVQSRNAQKSMGEFFDKLRNDRLHVESKLISKDIKSEQVKDALKLHLSLHYAGVTNSENIAKHITEKCLSVNVQQNIGEQ